MEPLRDEQEEKRLRLLGSLLFFIQYFYEIRTGREFKISNPVGRESHIITICRELTKVQRLEVNRLLINVPPGHGKSEILKGFVAWCMARNPDSQFLYISYSQELAAKHTYDIRQIIDLPQYRALFGIEIRSDSSAKDNFKTNHGGTVMAFGSSGSITGQDAGLPDLDRFSGGVIMDDMHKPDEVHSDTQRQRVIDNYNQTIKPRPRGINVPMVFLGQRLHEDDLPAYMIAGRDGFIWKTIILKAMDEAGNALHPTVNPKEMLLREQEVNPYVFSSQYQQDPQPSGGGIFKPEWFAILDEEPKIEATVITADTAETKENYNDATVFSFFGIYKIMFRGASTGLYGLHWIDCNEIRVEPKDLEAEFFSFYAQCMRHPVKPDLAIIEKKSTGVTLASTLKNLQGLRILDIQRTKASGNKTARYLEIQPIVAAGRVSISRNAKHLEMCLQHMRKITANNTHRFDDIADTLYDGVKAALIDKIVNSLTKITPEQEEGLALKLMGPLLQLTAFNERRI